jgi:DNA polymerase III epsilon subunit-like protein
MNPEYHLIFDTETTGLPPRDTNTKKFLSPRKTDKWEGCRVVQIAWILIDDTGVEIKRENYIIKPENFEIPEFSTKIHGISQTQAETEGCEIKDVLNKFLIDVERSKILVAHNISFDYSVVLSEISRIRKTNETWISDFMVTNYKTKKTHCTMLEDTKKYEKWPKLIELYRRYFKEDPQIRLHDALNDTEVCKRIYLHQIKNNKSQGKNPKKE